MNTPCNLVDVTLSVWSPRDGDLPDAVAEHLDQCPWCTARFNERFPPFSFVEPHLAPPIPDRSNHRWAMALGAAVAAVLLLHVPTPNSPGRVAWSAPGESLLTVEEQLHGQECPLQTETEHPVCEDWEWL